jgi:uncharacterized membrane protein YcaP (DUF421 family)
MNVMWSDMLVPAVPWVEKIVRPIVVYAFLIGMLRLSGKRLLAQLNPFDFVVLLILSNTVQNAIIGNDNSVTGGILGAAVLLFVNTLVVRATTRHEHIDQRVEGHADPLISDGAVQDRTLRRLAISTAELRIAAHKQGFESLDEIEGADIYPDGVIWFRRRHATDDHAQHEELISRLDRIERRLEGLSSRANV